MGNVTLPTPVFLAGGALCLVAGYLVGSVAGPDTPDRTRRPWSASTPALAKLCLEGDAIKDQEGVDADGMLCGTLRRTPNSQQPRARVTTSGSSRCAPPARSTASSSNGVIYGDRGRLRRRVAPTSTTKGVPGLLKLPSSTRSPWWELTRRLLMAIGILVFTVLLVYFDRDGYTTTDDPANDYRVGLVDSIYYTTVTLSTTGYGDIAPVARRTPD